MVKEAIEEGPARRNCGSLLQCSHLVRFFRTLVRIQTFFKKLVRKWSGFALKSLDLTKNGRINAENWSFSPWIQRWTRCFTKLKTSRIIKKSGKRLILLYWSGFKAHLGPDLVRIGTNKWSGFGPILTNLGPIWQVVALGRGGVGGDMNIRPWIS